MSLAHILVGIRRRRIQAQDATAPTTSVVTLIGPGLLVAAAGIGAGDVVSATVAGAAYGLALLWVVALAAFFKFVLNEGHRALAARHRHDRVEGWAAHLPAWVQLYFALYLVLWTVAVSAALTNASGLGIANLTGGAIPQSWGAVAHSLFGFAFVCARRLQRVREADEAAGRHRWASASSPARR